MVFILLCYSIRYLIAMHEDSSCLVFDYIYIIMFCLSSIPTSVRICQNLLWQFQQLYKNFVIRTFLIEIHANRLGFHDASSTQPPTLEGHHEAVPV